MPTVLRIGSFRFHFYSDEKGEPPHIHVALPDSECKFWLDPISLARNKGMKPHQIREAERIIYEYIETLRIAYEKYHSKS
ncbi:MAG: DUF4160 domain-containing protein [Spirochaetia bacterium]|nr:DUF4160 domain-containing protein [Spirochaetia bacterium]